jgi:hypothetical protein
LSDGEEDAGRAGAALDVPEAGRGCAFGFACCFAAGCVRDAGMGFFL